MQAQPHFSIKATVTAVTLVIASLLLFARLGHYPLWDDEAHTCLFAEGVWKTGDTTAIHGQNFVAYRQGLLIKDNKERSSPPLQFYLTAPFIGLGGNSAAWARLPTATLGFGGVALLLWWAWRADVDWATFALLGIAIIGNVSMILFFRQARYYSPMIFFSVAIAYSYWHLNSRRALAIHAAMSVLLLASNYLAYAAVTAMMVMDYAIWGRKRRPIRGVEWLILLLPQMLVGGVILWIWNPLSISTGDPSSDHGWLVDRFTLLWRTFRDTDRCEYACATLIVLALPIAIWKRQGTAVRAIVALAVGIVVIDFASPQSPRAVETADVRYFASLIPLAIVICVMTLRAAVGRHAWVALLIAPLAFWTNLLNVSPHVNHERRSTIWKFGHELVEPVPDPYTPAIEWIKGNLHTSDSIVAFPSYTAYPLMFHAPTPLYAWQFMPEQQNDPRYKYLDSIHFFGKSLPDYFISFGPEYFLRGFRFPPEVRYDIVKIIDIYPKDAYRPELMWRTFDPLPPDKEHGAAIYILKKSILPASKSEFRLQ